MNARKYSPHSGGNAKHQLVGTVVSGLGRMAVEMTTGPHAHFYATYFGHLEPGTFNVALPEPYTLVPEMVMPREDGQQVLVQACHVANLQGFIIQTLQPGEAPRPERTLAIVSAYPLRRYLRVSDGGEITISLKAPAAPSNDKGRQ